MGNQVLSSTENNFTKGFVSEFTGLNFPENAATDTDNCTYTLVGDVTRRLGIDLEKNFHSNSINRTGLAMNDYEWNNAGGDGVVQILVSQVGGTIYFYSITAATVLSPLSNNKLASTVTLSSFLASGASLDTTLECQFSSGNGYLFIYHPNCDPIYCTYDTGTITGNRINVQIRDFSGVSEGTLPTNTRPTVLTTEHNYNLINQGWVAGNPWLSVSLTAVVVGIGSKSFTGSTGLTVTLGDQVTIIANHVSPGLPATGPMMSGNITAYNSGTGVMTVNVTSGSSGWFGQTGTDWLIVPRNTAYISSWFSSVGTYPSNSDVWWYFKNSSGNFDPATTLNNVSLGQGNAPRGHFILDAFSQQRDVASSLAITDVSTVVRPRIGTWFQGRVWYTGIDAQQASTGDAVYYSWTENVYFSKIVNSVDDFGRCYQVNDPTSETLFDLLPTDGGVIQIQGCGKIFELFPIQNGMLVRAANGIWQITGSRGIGFAANDYTINKISSIKSISTSSSVDVDGLPYFWNEDGIYSVTPAQNGGLTVSTLTYSTIDTYYSTIPLSSKKYARGGYDPINYTVKWLFKDTEASSVTDRYSFNKILNYNTANKAFYPYSVDNTVTSLNGLRYISGPGGSTCPPPAFKSICSTGTVLSIADEHDINYVDWASTTQVNFDSYFITGYKLHGQAQRRFQMPYVYVFSRADDPTSYKIQGLWDYAISGNSGRWSTAQLINNWSPNFGMIFRRHRIRGQGLVLQIKVSSVDGKPFDIMGWSSFETQNTGV